MSKLLNFVGFQVGWFACILGAAKDIAWVGPVVVVTFLGATFAVRVDRANLAMRLIAASVVGFVADSSLALLGVLEWPTGGVASPLWMTALWPNLAATLDSSLAWLAGRYGLAVGLGAVVGPAAYYAGAQLGALRLGEGSAHLVAVAVEWMLALPLLLLMNNQTRQKKEFAI